jgi:hypothetical protein
MRGVGRSSQTRTTMIPFSYLDLYSTSEPGRIEHRKAEGFMVQSDPVPSRAVRLERALQGPGRGRGPDPGGSVLCCAVRCCAVQGGWTGKL